MNVGILSLPRVRNWGSFLQAFALKKTVEAYGHECFFLDIKINVGVTMPASVQSNENTLGDLFAKIGKLPRILFRSLKQELLKRSKTGQYQQKFRNKYDVEFLPLLGIDKVNNQDETVLDLVIIGSDQVFNCTQRGRLLGETLQFFGEGIDAKKIITYAASFGFTTIDDLERHDLKTKITKALENVSTISVRDMNSYSIIEQLTGKPPELHVDPVLMFDFSSYMPNTVPISNYLIVYTYQQDIIDPEIVHVIKEYAARKQKRVVSLYSYHDWCEQCIIPNTPFQLLAYFANADYVVTDTFHGTVFSIKFNRNFIVLTKDRNTHRVDFLLKHFALTDRVVRNPADIECRLEEGVDYSKCNSIFDAEVKKARSYLKEALNL